MGKGLSYIDTNTPLGLQQPQEVEVVYAEIQKSFIEWRHVAWKDTHQNLL